MADFDLPTPLEETQEPDNPMSALMALSRAQQRRREEALARLRAVAQQQGAQAEGLRNMALLSSFGQNPLLQGLQREAGGQGAQLQGMAAQAESRADTMGRGVLDPLGIARLQQLSDYQRKQQELAAQKLAQDEAQAAAKAQAAKDKAAADAGKKAKTEEDKRAERLWKDAESMRKEFSTLPDVKEFTPFENAYKGLQSALARPGGVGSTAAIFNFMKLIDPGVAVMEGDVERIRASAGPAAKFADIYEYAITGNTLPAKVRAELESMAGELYSIRKDRYEERRKQYGALAKKRGVAPEDVLPPTPTAPQVQRVSPSQALPPGPGGSLLLGPPPTTKQPNTVRVRVNGQELPPMPRSNLEAAKKRAADKGYTLEVIDG